MAIVTFSAPVQAFEVDGFRSGMSEAEALTIAQDYDSNARIGQLRGDAQRSTLDFGYPGSADKPQISFGLFFYQSKLNELTKIYTVLRWDLLSDTVSKLNKRYGHGTVEPYKDESQQTKLNGLELSWKSNVDEVHILVQAVSYKTREIKEKIYIYENYKRTNGNKDFQ